MRKLSSEIEPVLAVLKEPAIFLNIDERLPVCKIPTSIKSRIDKASRALREQLKPVGGVF
jgi:hypothetical protein